VHHFLLAAEVRKRRITATSRVDLVELTQRLAGAEFGGRDCTRGGRQITAANNQDQFSGACAAAAPRAPHAASVKSNPEATTTRVLAGTPSLAELKRLESESQSE
jgi:hypothetical protein